MSKELLKHWKIKKLPFRDRPLDEGTLELFSNREQKLRELGFLEDDGLICLHGSQGVGKTSFYHRFLSARRKVEGGNIDYLLIHIRPERNTICLQVLKSVLEAIKGNKLSVKNKRSLSINQKLERIEQIITVSESIQSEVGTPNLLEQVWAKFKVLFSKQTARAFNPITDDKAAEELGKLFAAIKKKALLVIDNTERLANFFQTNREYAAWISQFSDLLESTFDPEKLTVAVSTDERFLRTLRRSSEGTNEIPAHAFSAFLEVDPLDLESTRLLIEKRLNDSGYKNGVDAFIDTRACEVLQNVSDGFPRAVVLILGHALRIGCMEGKTAVDEELIWDAYGKLVESGQISRRKHREQTSETDDKILQYLGEHGGRSPSDDDLVSASGLGTSQLAERMKRLESLGLLESYRQGKKRLFQIPAGPTGPAGEVAQNESTGSTGPAGEVT